MSNNKDDFKKYRQCTNCFNRLAFTGGHGSYCTEHDVRIGDIDPVTCEFFSVKSCKTCIGLSKDILESGMEAGYVCNLIPNKPFIDPSVVDSKDGVKYPGWCPMIGR